MRQAGIATPPINRRERPRQRVAILLQLALATVLLSGAALYNGFPLVYPDSNNYLGKAYEFTHPTHTPFSAIAVRTDTTPATSDLPLPRIARSIPYNPFFLRPAGYPVFLVPFANGWLLPALPFAQSFLVVLVVFWALESAGVDLQPVTFVLLVSGLAALTSLPWFAGQVMPDIFTGLIVLLSFLGTLGAQRLTRTQQMAVPILTALSITTHLSHLPLFSGLFAAATLYLLVRDRRRFSWRRFCWFGILPLTFAVAALCAINYLYSGRFVLSESSRLFYLAHLVDDGTAQLYLDETCQTRHWIVCADHARLPKSGDYFLWSPGGSWQRNLDSPPFLAEASEIVRGTLQSHGTVEIAASVEGSFHQLGAFGLDESLWSRDLQAFRPLMGKIGAGTLTRFAHSRQATGTLALSLFQRLQIGTVWAAVVVLAGCCAILLARGRASSGLRLIGFILSGLCLNALVIGSSSALHDRYQSRVIWLLPLAAFIAVRECVSSRPLVTGSSD
jgi:hypothetical protein